MKYSVERLIQKTRRKERPKFLFFWGHQPSKDGSISTSCLSQWWKSEFESGGKRYKTAEHWMMAKKAELFDPDRIEQILKAKSPAQAKMIGRNVEGFSNEIWDKHKYEIVRQGTFLKFSQNEELATFLINTKKRILVEASPVDPIWGLGLAKDHRNAGNPSKWRGENLLGFALMEVRDELAGR